MTVETLNGVALAPIGQFIDAVKAEPDTAHITFRASSRWTGGTKADVAVTDFQSNGTSAAPQGRSFS